MRHLLSVFLASLVTVAAGQSAAPLPNHVGSLKGAEPYTAPAALPRLSSI